LLLPKSLSHNPQISKKQQKIHESV
jgi:hypothetical protein